MFIPWNPMGFSQAKHVRPNRRDPWPHGVMELFCFRFFRDIISRNHLSNKNRQKSAKSNKIMRLPIENLRGPFPKQSQYGCNPLGRISLASISCENKLDRKITKRLWLAPICPHKNEQSIRLTIERVNWFIVALSTRLNNEDKNSWDLGLFQPKQYWTGQTQTSATQ